ncbi:MAG: M20/M25/M40 family metallo-hydrolase [Defluviitaleaceae bacterium]|nr:M20/M25/M40 family metallo-hydrolase [Defluviitaleaceae bacterium]
MLLERLTTACGLPGFEDEVRDIIKEELTGFVDSVKIDRMGNLIVVKNENATGKHIAISAHMDEVGLCVRHIEGNGEIKFSSWGVDRRLLPSMRVLVGEKRTLGVIGTKPIHLQTADEANSSIAINSLYIDIGCDKKEDCEKLVNLGDFVAFDSKYTEFGDNRIKAKALDDRVGCATIIEVLKSDIPHKVTGIFCVQEEIGVRGSMVAANRVNADLYINLEGTIGADLDGIKPHEHVTTQGGGPAISVMDRSSLYFRKHIDEIIAVAEKNGIPWQYRRSGMGGTDARNYHLAKTGTPVIGLAVPCRYIHSPVSTMHKSDFENLVRLVRVYVAEFGGK